MWASVFCGSLQRLVAMELRWIWGWWREICSGDRCRRKLEDEDAMVSGSRDQNVVCLFFRDLCAKRLGRLSSVSHVCVLYRAFYRY
jgi:hypothetical protein